MRRLLATVAYAAHIVKKDVRSEGSLSAYFPNTVTDACAEMFDVEKLICEVEKKPPL
jgi:hypothetical protein